MKIILYTASIFLTSVSLHAQLFIALDHDIPAVGDGSIISWVDYDGDNDLDLFIAGWDGRVVTDLYRNDGGGIFTETLSGIPGFTNGSAVWQDYDGDGDLDLFISGELNDNEGGGPICQVYRNINGTFELRDVGEIAQVMHGASAWGDYDNDGDMDLLITGTATDTAFATPISVLYRLTSTGFFLELEMVQLLDVWEGDVGWADIDGDGDSDFVLTGTSGSSSGVDPLAEVYRNDGNNVFTPMNANIDGMGGGAVVAWGDYDNDGDMDLLMAGQLADQTVTTRIYDNNGFGDLSENQTHNLIGLGQAAAAWGDYNNDGAIDFAISGLNNAATPQTLLYENDRLGGFAQAALSTPELYNGTVDFVDFDNEGDLDLVLTGTSPDTQITELFQNNHDIPNQPPSTPVNLDTTREEFQMILSWDPATDAETANSAGLSYNLRIGTSPGANDILSGAADSLTGYRWLPDAGNGAKTNRWDVENLAPGTFYWAVQTIDGGFVGSTWSEEQIFTIDSNFVKTNFSIAGIDSGFSKWADYNNDTHPDFIVSGFSDDGEPVSLLYSGDGNGTFTDTQANLKQLQGSAGDWGDFDNDGDLDLALCGRDINGIPLSFVYRNDSGVLTDLLAGLDGVSAGEVAWGDFDNDGDQDLFLSGAPSPKLYRNDQGSFVLQSVVGLPQSATNSVRWVDYDNNSQLDLFIDGVVFKNEGPAGVDWSFSATVILPLASSKGSWGDYDNDGDLDLAYGSAIYRNDANDTFEPIVDIQLPTGGDEYFLWGDYSLNGSLDIIYSGYITIPLPRHLAKPYRNVNGAIFSEDLQFRVRRASDGWLSWDDYDTDGDLDLLLMGDGGTNRVFAIYENTLSGSNERPLPPLNLVSSAVDSMVSLSWIRGMDAETPQFGLSYNLRIGSQPNGVNIMSPDADVVTGERRIARMGNTQMNTSWILSGLEEGTYFWSVQSIDHGFAGSAFTSEYSFIIGPELSLPQSTLDFGGALVGFRTTASLEVVNLGSATLRITELVLTDNDGAAFDLDGAPVLPLEIGRQSSDNISIGFTPPDVEEWTATLTISTNDQDNSGVQVSLIGTGIAPDISIEPTQLDFGSLILGLDSLQRLTIRNIGSSQLTVDSTSFSRFGSGAYSILVGDAPFTLGVDSSQFVEVLFEATAAGPSPDSLFIYSDVLNSIEVSVPLSGETAIDSTPPLVTLQTTQFDSLMLGEAFPVVMQIVDTDAPIQSATLFYRLGGALSATSIELNPVLGDLWGGLIPAGDVTIQGIEYFMRVVHGGDSTYFPSSSFNAPNYAAVKVPELLFPEKTLNTLYQLISIPLDTDGQTLSQLFDELGAYDSTQYRIFDYDASSENYIEQSSLTQALPPGTSMWMITNGRQDLIVSNARSVVTLEPYAINLDQGWNLIGMPFGFAVNWNLVDRSNISDQALVAYDGTGFFQATEMEPFKGYAVHAITNSQLLIPPIQAGGTIIPKVSALSDDEWRLQVSVERGQYHDRSNYAGVRSSATAGDDAYDLRELSAPGNYVATYFVRITEDGEELLSRDYRGAGEEGYQFDLQISGNVAGVTRLLVTPENLPDDWDWALVSPASKVLYPQDQILFQLSEQRLLLMAGTRSYLSANLEGYEAVPTHFDLGPNYPNPFNPSTTIPYQLPSAQHVRIDVFNMLGQKVETLIDNVLHNPGYFEAEWRGTTSSGARAASGVYILRLDTEQFTRSIKMVLIR